MKTSDTLRFALRNLRQSKLRTSLTALGVSIGIASLVGMVSFGVAIQDQVMGAFLRAGIFDAITVTAVPLPRLAGRRPLGGGRQATRNRPAPSAQRPKLDDDALKTLAALPHVREVYPDLRVPVEVKFGTFSEFSTARGIPLSARGEGVFQEIRIGKFFDNDTDDACLLSVDFARRLSDDDPEMLVGSTLSLGFVSARQPSAAASTGERPDAGASSGAAQAPNVSEGTAARRAGGDPAAADPFGMLGLSVPGGAPGGMNLAREQRPFRIVGIVAREAGAGAAGGLGLFGPVMIPLAKAREMGGMDLSNAQAILRQLADRRTYAVVTVRVDRAQDTEEVENRIKDLGFSAFSVADLLQGQKRAFILLDLLLGLVGSIALTVASLGITNTMVMSILERTREIGIMKAIGGGDHDVRRIFLVEAGLIGLIGGVFGILLGWAVGRVINVVANYYLESQGSPTANLFLIPWWLVAGGLAFAVVVGLVAGGFPAARAARLDPIQALRHD